MNKETQDRVKTWAAILPFVLMAIAGYYEMKQDMAVLGNRVDTLTASNDRTIQVFEQLATSVNRLSNSVARLDERTRALEN